MDISETIKAKSDQLNAVDFGEPIKYKIVDAKPGPSKEQPVNVSVSGDARVWRPSLGMRRILFKRWGKDTADWVGKWIELDCDPSVPWAGKPAGGIVITAIELQDEPGEDIIERVRTSRTSHKDYKIRVLKFKKGEK